MKIKINLKNDLSRSMGWLYENKYAASPTVAITTGINIYFIALGMTKHLYRTEGNNSFKCFFT